MTRPSACPRRPCEAARCVPPTRGGDACRVGRPPATHRRPCASRRGAAGYAHQFMAPTRSHPKPAPLNSMRPAPRYGHVNHSCTVSCEQVDPVNKDLGVSVATGAGSPPTGSPVSLALRAAAGSPGTDGAVLHVPPCATRRYVRRRRGRPGPPRSGIARDDGSNSRASSSGVRPARARSTICCRYSAAYGGLVFGIANAPPPQQDRCPRNRGNFTRAEPESRNPALGPSSRVTFGRHARDSLKASAVDRGVGSVFRTKQRSRGARGIAPDQQRNNPRKGHCRRAGRHVGYMAVVISLRARLQIAGCAGATTVGRAGGA